jgi:hypothetical protein
VYKIRKNIAQNVYTTLPCGIIKVSTEVVALGNSKINRGRQRREELREAAIERAASRDSRSNSEQIELLNARLGENCGAAKERKKLEVDSKANVKSKKTSGSTRQARKKEKAARYRDREEKSA